MRCRFLLLPIVSAAVLGCQSPINERDDALRESVRAAIERQIDALPEQGEFRPLQRPPVDLEERLAPRMEELRAIMPPTEVGPGRLDLGPDLFGGAQREVTVSLQTAIATAVRNNLAGQQARLEPAIAETEVVAAQAMFDTVLFSNVGFALTDQPTTTPVIGGVPIGTGVAANRQWRFDTGLRRSLETGGSVFISGDLTRTRNRNPNVAVDPDPAYATAVRLGLSQPLLRGFGADVNLAPVRLARNIERGAIQELRRTLLETVFQVERVYWDLVVARQDLATRMWLVEVGEEVRDILERRLEFDARQAQYADAVATVEQRKGQLLRSRRLVRELSDRLKALMNDADLSVENEVMISPADRMVESAIRIDLREGILTAMENRPEVIRALLAVDDASIRLTVADNQRLPTLNLAAEMAWFGLDRDLGDSVSEVGEGSFVDYLVGLAFEQPLGNRAGEAAFRGARLRRSSAVIGYRRVVQDLVVDVKNALRDCITTYELISAARSFRLAQAETLRALLVEEQNLASLTPEFLQLKFNQQERLAEAQRQEIAALAGYNISVAELHRALGTGLAINRVELEVESRTD